MISNCFEIDCKTNVAQFTLFCKRFGKNWGFAQKSGANLGKADKNKALSCPRLADNLSESDCKTIRKANKKANGSRRPLAFCAKNAVLRFVFSREKWKTSGCFSFHNLGAQNHFLVHTLAAQQLQQAVDSQYTQIVEHVIQAGHRRVAGLCIE